MIRQNPWLYIPAEDYEGHMSSNNVRQLEALSDIFRKVIFEFRPQSIMLLGCATGNGLEHLSGNEEVVGVDINPDYLEQCRKRFSNKFPGIKLLYADLNSLQYELETFELIHAALIFEYVAVENLLRKIGSWLKPDGYFSAVIQLKSKSTAAITDTEYNSLKTLQTIHNLVNPDLFLRKCIEIGYKEIDKYEVILPGEKKFKVMIFQKCD